MVQCPGCATAGKHTNKFEKIYSTILDEMTKRKYPGLEDPEELAKTLAVLIADSLDIDIYE